MGIYSFPRLVSAHFLMLFIAQVYSLNSDVSSALLALKAYISPESQNVLANNWTTATSVCNWIGVICGGQPQRVVALNLSSMGLDGTLPPIGTTPSALGSITSLKKIDLSYNKLSGSIASTIFNLSSLQIIDLSHNMLAGNLPADMANRLPELKELYLSRNQLYGQIPSSLFNCRQLKVLSLSSNSFTGNISINLGNLTMLKDLDLSTNNFEGRIPSSIGNCSSLKTMNFSENNLEEYGSSGIVSKKTDVYSFGILLMETFTGKKPTDNTFNGEMSLRSWIFESLPNAMDRITDVTLLKNDQEDIAAKTRCIKSIMKVAWFCTVESFSQRKTMIEVECKLCRIKSRFLRDAKLIEECEVTQMALHPRILFRELKLATDGFSERNLLDSGKSSFVYKGTLEDKCVVAIKIFNLQKRGLEGFEAHCQALSFIRHRNVVKILKCCSDIDFKALVVEYMPNGSLQNYLHPGMNIFNFQFQHRLDIMINVASALSYLHSMRVIHCNLSPTNVLLDEDMVARISGFSIAQFLDKGSAETITTTMAETPGYMAPEYESTGNVSEKTDVYSFGILLMETFTILRPTEAMNWRSRICDSLQSEDKIAGLDFQQTDQEGITATATPTKRFLRTILRLIYCCTSELPKERKGMWAVETELVRLKQQFRYSFDGNIYRHRASGGNEMQELD